MSIKDIIVSVDLSDTGRERMLFAMDIAQSHGAFVTAFYTSPTVSAGEGAPDEIAQAVEAAFDLQLRTRELAGAWMLSDEPVADDLITQIRHVDLAILGLGSPDNDDRNPQGFRIADVVRSCGRPILAVPISRLSSSRFSRVLVAWDGSREATRALHDAIPLLRGAETIQIASIGSVERAQPELIVQHLARHGLTAVMDTTPPYEFEIGAELLQRAAMDEVDLVVAGAYGHSKFGESLFGGASDTLLHQMLVPVLLSH
ncbi:universal stress protein [Kaistia dalseonensis]|uniref:Nucleotide-binding universal stress UspA family protein n=1 Tax=Kaistia dalseonensis TaxID=410840 RepID=A0ABU0H3X5_9HYPH|nr:universal stress protein [Kaistia dalseonensis]MCX5494424.1 universal stress protein [Kaistia dalseonensis]MDQ0437003.1 nucleotide-binding universal stress UspA family protein [Kaistia dalseonensis]